MYALVFKGLLKVVVDLSIGMAAGFTVTVVITTILKQVFGISTGRLVKRFLEGTKEEKPKALVLKVHRGGQEEGTWTTRFKVKAM